jgi:hypothetical protein
MAQGTVSQADDRLKVYALYFSLLALLHDVPFLVLMIIITFTPNHLPQTPFFY